MEEGRGLAPAPSARHEYSSMDVTLEVVPDMAEAINHIHQHGSGHTECIITGACSGARGGVVGSVWAASWFITTAATAGVGSCPWAHPSQAHCSAQQLPNADVRRLGMRGSC